MASSSSTFPPLSSSPFFPATYHSDDDIEISDETKSYNIEDDDDVVQIYTQEKPTITTPFPLIFQVDLRNKSFSQWCFVEPLSDAWHQTRKGRVGSSEIGGWCGLAPYVDKKFPYKSTSPAYYLKSKIKSLNSSHSDSEMDPQMARNVGHGIKFEPQSFLFFQTNIMPTLDVKFQWVRYPAAYHIPNPLVNPNFLDPDDVNLFGASPDIEGDIFDVEIKNAINYYPSFYKKYLPSFKPEYFAQVQHLMAIRNRRYMYLFATSYDDVTGTLIAWVLRLALCES